MPIYEYKCQDCGKITEFLLKSHRSREKPECFSCGSKNMERLISAPGMLKVEWGSTARSSSSKTCCGKSEPCDKPPCADDGSCKKYPA